MKYWWRIPEWGRWILCWPVMLVAGIASAIIVELILWWLLVAHGVSKPVFDVVSPALMSLMCIPVFFYSVYTFVPRRPTIVTGLCVGISTILGVMSVIRWIVEIIERSTEFAPLLTDALQTIAAVGGSWYWFFRFKWEPPSREYEKLTSESAT